MESKMWKTTDFEFQRSCRNQSVCNIFSITKQNQNFNAITSCIIAKQNANDIS